MKKQIVQVSVLQSAKVVAGVYFIIAIPAAVLMGLGMSIAGQGHFSVALLIVLPLLYAFCAFLFSAFGAWIYNLVAAHVGGFEFTTAEVNAASQ